MVLLWDNKTFFGNIKLTKSDNIRCYYMLSKCVFWDNTVQKMGHLTPFCRNINVIMGQYKMFFGNIKLTESYNIWCYYML
jgi:hypothetical protein